MQRSLPYIFSLRIAGFANPNCNILHSAHRRIALWRNFNWTLCKINSDSEIARVIVMQIIKKVGVLRLWLLDASHTNIYNLSIKVKMQFLLKNSAFSAEVHFYKGRTYS